jgi:hypothetical protein
MTGKRQVLSIVAAGFTLALVLAWMLPSRTGLTVYLPHQARYIGANIFGFWCALVVTLAIAAIVLALQKKA